MLLFKLLYYIFITNFEILLSNLIIVFIKIFNF